MPAAEAGKFAHRWGSQLTELEAMGFDVTPRAAELRSEVNSELNFPPNFEGLVLGCIDADFCK